MSELPHPHVLRVARPTDRLETLRRMYVEGLGLAVIAEFADHDGFDGVILGRADAPYHLEFTSSRLEPAGGAPSSEHLLVFYLADADEWANRCEAMLAAGFVEVTPANPWWALHGRTFADADGYRVVLCPSAWEG